MCLSFVGIRLLAGGSVYGYLGASRRAADAIEFECYCYDWGVSRSTYAISIQLAPILRAARSDK